MEEEGGECRVEDSRIGQLRRRIEAFQEVLHIGALEQLLVLLNRLSVLGSARVHEIVIPVLLVGLDLGREHERLRPGMLGDGCGTSIRRI